MYVTIVQTFMNVYQSQAKTKSFSNTDMPAKFVLTTVSPIPKPKI